jgi:hypothetical protein
MMLFIVCLIYLCGFLSLGWIINTLLDLAFDN